MIVKNMKWYESLIKIIENHGNNIFLYDLEELLNDRNFYMDLSEKYEIFYYNSDEDYYIFKNSKSDKQKLIYSNSYIKRAYTKNALKISISDVFDNLVRFNEFFLFLSMRLL